MFMKVVFYTNGVGMKEKKLVTFQRTLVITRYPPEQLTHATMITLVWDGA
jgi:hypothetical protein